MTFFNACTYFYSSCKAKYSWEAASIGGRLTLDADGNDNEWNSKTNTWDSGLAGKTVQLIDAWGKVVASTTTSADGSYKFTGLAAGSYKVKFPGQSGYEFSKKNAIADDGYDSDANADGTTDTITVGKCQNIWNVDAGLKAVTPPPPPPGGECIVIEAEAMQLCNYTVENFSGASGGKVVKGSVCDWASATTKFTGAAGTYDLKLSVLDENDGRGLVSVYVNGHLVSSTKLDQDNGGNGYDGHPTFRVITIDDLNLKAGDVITIYGYGQGGEYARLDKIQICKDDKPVPGSVGDLVWLDADKDGVRDAGESGVAGATVRLVNAAGTVIATTTTDANGNYKFSDVAPGTYSVQVVPPAGSGLVFTTQNAGSDDNADSDVDASGATATFTVASGQNRTDIDAGLKDPGTAAIGDTVWIDADKDGVLDGGEAGAAGVEVKLLNASGTVIATTTTDANGKYSFTGLNAGSYSVHFGTLAGFGYTTAGAAADDAVNGDSDAGAGGSTGTIVLSIGETENDIDAGLVALNSAPEADDDAAETCASVPVSIDVLDNDSDPEGDTLTITSVDGKAITEGGSVTLDSGVIVSLIGGELVVDGSATYEGLLFEEYATETFSYHISDGQGGTAEANVEVTFRGETSTCDEIADSLPESIGYQVIRENRPVTGSSEAFTVKLTSLDARFDGLVIEEAYCAAFFEPVDNGPGGSNIDDAPLLTGNIYIADKDSIPAGSLTGTGNNGQAGIDNLDLVNWILNQDFGSIDNGDGTGTTYTDAEIQGAIWKLLDGVLRVEAPNGSTLDNVVEIYEQAIAQGEGYEVCDGDVIGLFIDPNPATAENSQPFLLAVDYDTLALTCEDYGGVIP